MNEAAKCEPCDGQGRPSAAVSYCKDCDESLCQTCADQHKALKATKNHVLGPISERMVYRVIINSKVQYSNGVYELMQI